MVLIVLFVMMAHSAFSKQNNTSDEYDVIAVTVQPGDTLWSIAKEYKADGADLREFVYDIAANNGVKDCEIVCGQTLFIPNQK
jgi:LysM repeat protein